MESKQSKEAKKLLAASRLDAVDRMREIDAQIHLLTKEKNLLGVSIDKIDAKFS